ncbi:hypothetical protein KM043_000781 [Ampulex compressa]|nr:hypothetical protein KM043_000781 [Ampulex compressa]
MAAGEEISGRPAARWLLLLGKAPMEESGTVAPRAESILGRQTRPVVALSLHVARLRRAFLAEKIRRGDGNRKAIQPGGCAKKVEAKERFSRGREFGVMKEKEGEKRSSKLTGASGKPGATGSPLCPKNSSVLLRRGLPLSPPWPSPPCPSHRPRLYPGLLVAHLEARQMSGIRLRHLSVSPSVTFDSRQIDER